jgi:hypothetical protein
LVKKPFTQVNVSNNVFIREFSTDVSESELLWHWDEKERLVEFINDTDWMIQLDDRLPMDCKGSVIIKAGEWHRLIKGSVKLVVKITEE